MEGRGTNRVRQDQHVSAGNLITGGIPRHNRRGRVPGTAWWLHTDTAYRTRGPSTSARARFDYRAPARRRSSSIGGTPGCHVLESRLAHDRALPLLGENLRHVVSTLRPGRDEDSLPRERVRPFDETEKRYAVLTAATL
jgi:hypothetical protein